MNKPHRIVLTGHSASGKSTLARALGEQIGWPVFSIDNYWIKGGGRLTIERAGQKLRLFDHPSLYDGARLAKELPAGSPAIIEGFVVFHYPELCGEATMHFHLNVPFEKCLERRKARRRRPSSLSDFESKIGWVGPGLPVTRGAVPTGC